ncbi:MAG: glycoside hydrolase family 2 protein, partial [Lachnospiraceae bacterium]|nr:glycoside hydrolase family 2 protein [Lachnospiraceae bacterium]
MEKINFNPVWKMSIRGEGKEYPATVPGSVYNDLLRSGRIEDPYYRDNEDAALKLMDNEFEYVGTFNLNQSDIADADEVLLRFNGIDTLADISLNGQMLGSADNMHRIWEYRIKEILTGGENEIKIVFHSPTKYIAEEFEKDPAILGTEDAMRGFPKIRKGHYMFGWDWGPRLPDAGIWKNVELLKVKKAGFTSTYIHQEFNEDMSKVSIRVRCKAFIEEFITEKPEILLNKDSGFDIKVSVTDPKGSVIFENADGYSDLTIDNPELWWPNGFGEHPLYTVKIGLFDKEGNLLDSSTKRIGLRKLEISTAKDEYGAEFAQVVNGVKFFAMGADYIPEDNMLPLCNADRTRKLLSDCVAANFNSIRVWGGGLYPDDYFFDICDELGLVVWQDFMFACANYRLTRHFEENILTELKEQIRRLSHHASLGLWCGNNEMEMFVDQGTWGAKFEIKSDYVKMYEYLFPRLLEEEDPDRFYWPASPSTGGGFDYPNDPNRGDVHYWEVWHGNKPFTEYRQFYFRYLSEFGFQSFP